MFCRVVCVCSITHFLAVLLSSLVVLVNSEQAGFTNVMPGNQDYSMMYWTQGFPAVQTEAVPWHRAILAGEYCMVMDTEALSIVHFGRVDTGLSYVQAATASESACESQPGMDLTLSIFVEGEKFVCTAGGKYDASSGGPRLIDSGRFVQRADVTDLVFTSETDGSELPVEARLEIMASPHSLSFILQARPGFAIIPAGEGVFGKVGSGFGLDGTNHLALDDPQLNLSVFTAEVWVFLQSDYSSGTAAYPWILCKRNHEWSDGNFGFLILHGRPRANINIGGGAAGVYEIYGPSISEFNRWYHFVLTLDATNFQFYLNGALMGQKILAEALTPSTKGTYLGRRDGGDGYHLKGIVDEFRVYDRVLTGAEVLSLYEDPLTCDAAGPSPVYAVDFNEGGTGSQGNAVGVIGAGLGLDGSNGFQVAHQAAYDPVQFTLGLWVLPPPDFSASASTSTPWLACKNSDAATEGYIGVKANADGSVQAEVNIGGNVFTIEGTSGLGKCDWNHVALTYDGTNLALYINGAAAGESVVGVTRVAGGGDWMFGARCDGGDDSNLRGVVDEVALFSRALSAAEVAAQHSDPAAAAAGGVLATDVVEVWSFGSDKSADGIIRKTLSNAAMEVSVQRQGDPAVVGERWELGSGEVWSDQYFETFLSLDPIEILPLPAPPVVVTATQVYNGASLAVAYNASRGVYQVDMNNVYTVTSSGDFDQWSNDVMERVTLSLHNPSDKEQVVTLMFEKVSRPGVSSPILLREGFPITGISAMLRDLNGEPLGIPVQLSKNWHGSAAAGFYNGLFFHGYSVVRLPPGKTLEAELSIVYGHYGGLPAASHAQLSVVGYKKNQQWDQSAMGAWGESICYDAEGVLNPTAITDVRPLMVTGFNENHREYGWTSNVGGGDFLRMFDTSGARVKVRGIRTAYDKYGPCLTEVTYSGWVGAGLIKHSVTTSLSRGDDYVRGTYRLRMDVKQALAFKRFVVFGIGSDSYSYTGEAKMAHGNIDGMLSEWDTEWGGNTYRHSVEAGGVMPWISLHQAVSRDSSGGAWANRGIVIRSWTAVVGGVSVSPWFAEYGADVNSGASSLADVILPPSITSLQPGDYVEAVFQHIVMPQFKKDYYGPNQGLVQALAAHENTWEMILRESAGNNRVVDVVTGGELGALYPSVVVDASGGKGGGAELRLSGGIGYVPVTFTGLTFPTGYSLSVDGAVLDQSEHSNDFWQTDYDAGSQTWSQTYNVPRLDGAATAVVELSYSHECLPGYEVADDGVSCQDVDECGVGNGGCDQICTNTEGAFECSCNVGYVMVQGGLGCSAIVCGTHLCYYSSDELQSWAEATTYCHDTLGDGWALACPNSEAESRTILEALGDRSPVEEWVGWHGVQGTESVSCHSTDDLLSYNNWKEGANPWDVLTFPPDDQSCVQIESTEALWATQDCTSNRRVICSKEYEAGTPTPPRGEEDLFDINVVAAVGGVTVLVAGVAMLLRVQRRRARPSMKTRQGVVVQEGETMEI